MYKISRNDPCQCGSGKKYKKCCYLNDDKNKEIQRAVKKAKSKDELQLFINEEIKVYQFKIILDSIRFDSDFDVWRTLEIKGNQTLFDLHLEIQNAFNWDNDHLFSFFLTNKIWDKKSEYSGNPFGKYVPSTMFENTSKPAGETEIRDLEITEGRQFKYLFDYGDEIIHSIETLKIYISNEEDDNFPRIIESKGKAPGQYDY